MKSWAYDQIAPAAAGAIDKTLADWPYLREALAEEGIRLPGDTPATTLTKICKLILAERKTLDWHPEPCEQLQKALLAREVYVNLSEIAERYGDYCEAFFSTPWLELNACDDGEHISPVDYIVARVSK